jgi:hypothetical protein
MPALVAGIHVFGISREKQHMSSGEKDVDGRA